MRLNINLCISTLSGTLAILMASCNDEIPSQPKEFSDGKIKMEFTFSHPDATRVTETAFETNDALSLFVCESNQPLQIAGNTVNNERLQFNGTSWIPTRNLYWDEGNYNVYAYYPFQDRINSISDLEFEVQQDQQNPTASGLNGYEASDFLFASAVDVAASTNPVNLKFRHIMSKLSVRLIKGEDFTGDIPTDISVKIHSVVTKATIDLQAGVATKDMYAESKTIIAHRENATTYCAIVVPQRLDGRVPLIEVTIGNSSYIYESNFQFKSGMHHLVNMVLDKNPEQSTINLGGEIINWN